ncbi:MAG TPA: hypothetical protein VEF90_15505 [Xanthobacteraceae bacterium]|nr:hypothetical protein [Xanthobacteraceae bacterium]
MILRISNSGTGLLAAAGLIALLAGTALAQTSPAPGSGAPGVQQAPAPPAAAGFPPQPAPPALPGPPTEKRGFLNDFGKWWDQSIADFKARWKEQQTKIDDFNKQSTDAAKNAAAATSQAMKSAADALRPSHVIEIQQACPLAGNGAADCATAATNVCKAKGYNTGQPLDVRTAEKCTDSLWVSGRTPAAGDCPEETVLLRAACQ